jgi:hypothetical protein
MYGLLKSDEAVWGGERSVLNHRWVKKGEDAVDVWNEGAVKSGILTLEQEEKLYRLSDPEEGA